MTDDNELRRQIQRIEELVGKIEKVADPAARADALELIKSLMDLHGAAIERMLEILASAGATGLETIDRLAGDRLVASLLLLYGLHPLPFETRVIRALDEVRPHLEAKGGRVELLGIAGGEVRLRLEGSPQGCGSSGDALRQTIEEAIYESAPDLTALHIEVALLQEVSSSLVQLQGRTASRVEAGPPKAAGLDPPNLAAGSLNLGELSPLVKELE